jgi:sulfatase modifying factor 1
MNQKALILSFATLCGASFAWAAAGCGPAPKEADTGKAVSPPQKITCPEGQTLKGTECIAAAAKPACAAGEVEKDGKCAPAAPVCPDGTHVGTNGNTCVANETIAQLKVDPEPAKGPCPASMILVKGGTFKMGFLKNEVTVADVCLDVVEVTAKEYEGCVDGKSCNDNFVLACPETSTYKVKGREDHPMVCVDFPQAEAYCKSVSKRLPSDEEWEWAARGRDEGRLYSWGNDAPKDQLCWAGAGARTGTCPVRAHPASATPQGLLGMSGNVFEWTTSKLDSKGKDRVGRGGSWRDGLANLMRVDRPGKFEVTYRCGFLGIRCAVDPKK